MIINLHIIILSVSLIFQYTFFMLSVIDEWREKRKKEKYICMYANKRCIQMRLRKFDHNNRGYRATTIKIKLRRLIERKRERVGRTEMGKEQQQQQQYNNILKIISVPRKIWIEECRKKRYEIIIQTSHNQTHVFK